jgi:peptide/nickel transport system ATP-binding protein/oligopeptide transport system ATP-binding protein
MLLSVQNLVTHFFLEEGRLKAVDNISFNIHEKETLALVGESGCGKTIVALSLLNLVPLPGKVVNGKVIFQGQDLLKMNTKLMSHIRGNDIGMIFQEPGTALNPVFTIGNQIMEVLQRHLHFTIHKSRKRAIELLGSMGIPDPESRYKAYPFELSGGMKQRVMIAMAMATHPKLLIADEPTTALDMTVQSEILELLQYQQDKHGISILLITHDLGVVKNMANRVMVMYTGKIFEIASTDTLFDRPKHPYTQGLLNSIPRLGSGRGHLPQGIPGAVPDLMNLPSGCTFHPRCSMGDNDCISEFPSTNEVAPDHICACFKVKPQTKLEH